MGANFGMTGLDWQQRVNWDRLREYRIERARAMMKKHGIGAMLCMYDENVRYITGTLTPGWNRLKPGLRYAMLCGDGRPILFEQGDIGAQIERHSPWIPKQNVRHSFAWIKGAAGPASTQQVTKFTKAVLQAMKDNGVAGQKLGAGLGVGGLRFGDSIGRLMGGISALMLCGSAVLLTILGVHI